MTLETNSALSGLRVLVIEDNFLVADEIVFILETFGCKPVGPVARRADAVAALNQSQVDLALLDINLGAESGYSIAEDLEARDVPFVFMTGYDVVHLAERHRDHLCVQKPFTRDQLRQTLTHAVLQRSGETFQ